MDLKKRFQIFLIRVLGLVLFLSQKKTPGFKDISLKGKLKLCRNNRRGLASGRDIVTSKNHEFIWSFHDRKKTSYCTLNTLTLKKCDFTPSLTSDYIRMGPMGSTELMEFAQLCMELQWNKLFKVIGLLCLCNSMKILLERLKCNTDHIPFFLWGPNQQNPWAINILEPMGWKS